jgi:hypothetical protein
VAVRAQKQTQRVENEEGKQNKDVEEGTVQEADWQQKI